jgi:hypothetical protein
MFALFAPIAQLISARRGTAPTAGIARRLFESAGARAGQDARQAEELRVAAAAYLRVVR